MDVAGSEDRMFAFQSPIDREEKREEDQDQEEEEGEQEEEGEVSEEDRGSVSSGPYSGFHDICISGRSFFQSYAKMTTTGIDHGRRRRRQKHTKRFEEWTRSVQEAIQIFSLSLEDRVGGGKGNELTQTLERIRRWLVWFRAMWSGLVIGNFKLACLQFDLGGLGCRVSLTEEEVYARAICAVEAARTASLAGLDSTQHSTASFVESWALRDLERFVKKYPYHCWSSIRLGDANLHAESRRVWIAEKCYKNALYALNDPLRHVDTVAVRPRPDHPRDRAILRRRLRLKIAYCSLLSGRWDDVLTVLGDVEISPADRRTTAGRRDWKCWLEYMIEAMVRMRQYSRLRGFLGRELLQSWSSVSMDQYVLHYALLCLGTDIRQSVQTFDPSDVRGDFVRLFYFCLSKKQEQLRDLMRTRAPIMMRCLGTE